jgi:hypothetical protein
MIDNAIFCRHLTTGRPLPQRPDIASPQTSSFDSVNSPRPKMLAPIENPNILPSIDALDEQKTDKMPKDKKKKKKKKKDEEQDNLADVQCTDLIYTTKEYHTTICDNLLAVT